MSWVTNLLLHVGLADKGKIEAVNAFFAGSPGRGLVSLDDPSLPAGWYGGTKYLEAVLFVGAFNHLDFDRFIEHLRGIEWSQPGAVQVLVRDQEDERFRVVDVFSG